MKYFDTEPDLVVIGDIHGRADQLRGLLDAIAPRRQDGLIFLGDYIDIGSNSSDTISTLVEARNGYKHAIFLRGNHECELSAYMETGDMVRYAKLGGLATISSYVRRPLGDVHSQLMRALPSEHREFFDYLTDSYTIGEVVFSHAGIDPNAPSDRSRETMVTSHAELLSSAVGLECAVVCGHYFSPNQQIRIFGDVMCIDTGCGIMEGPLTAFSFSRRMATQVWPSGKVSESLVDLNARLESRLLRALASFRCSTM